MEGRRAGKRKTDKEKGKYRGTEWTQSSTQKRKDRENQVQKDNNKEKKLKHGNRERKQGREKRKGREEKRCVVKKRDEGKSKFLETGKKGERDDRRKVVACK